MNIAASSHYKGSSKNIFTLCL